MSIKYSEIRESLQTGDLLIKKTNKINSLFSLVLYLYQMIFNAKYSHVGIILKLQDRVFVVDAEPNMVKLLPISTYDEFYLIKTNIELTEGQIDYLLDYIGKPYSLWDVISYTIGLRNDPSELYCSELVSDFYNKVGLISDHKLGVTPDVIISYISALTNTDPVKVIVDKINPDVTDTEITK